MEPQQESILIVDDTAANLNVLSAILKKQGYRVRAAPNGTGALKTARKSPPNLILLDIQMPDMTGYEVCTELKADDTTKHIPVIFISALDEVMDKVEAFRVGGADYITKPFQIEEVLARVEHHLLLEQQYMSIRTLNDLVVNLKMGLEDIVSQTSDIDSEPISTIHEQAQTMLAQVVEALPDTSS